MRRQYFLEDIPCPECGEKALSAEFTIFDSEAIITAGNGIMGATIEPQNTNPSLNIIECDECGYETRDLGELIEHANKQKEKA